MGVDGYNPERLKHIPGQEGRVDDEEKARVMAEHELGHRELAQSYELYIKDPEKWHREDPDRMNPKKVTVYEEFERLGVTPEYIIKVGEIWGEVEGSLHDYRKDLQDKTGAELRGEARSRMIKVLLGKMKEVLKNKFGRLEDTDSAAPNADKINMDSDRMILVSEYLLAKNELGRRKRKEV